MTNYPGLSDMFYEGANVFKTHEGFRRSEEAAAAHQQGLAEAIQRQQHEAAMNPLRIEAEKQLGRTRKLTADLAEKEQPYKLKQIDYNAQKAEYEDMDRFGQALEQWGSIAEANQGQIPLELQSRMPKELAAVFAQPNGWQQAKAAGKAMRENSAKWLSQQSKQGSAEDIAALKAREATERQRLADEARARQAQLDRESRERLAMQRLENAHKLAADRRSGSSDKKTLEQYAVELDRAANEVMLDDPQAANALRQRSMDILQKAASLKAASAGVNDDFRRELMGLQNKYGTKPQPAQAAPAATAPASQDNDPLGIRKKP